MPGTINQKNMEQVLEKLILKRSDNVVEIAQMLDLHFHKEDAMSNAFYTIYKWDEQKTTLPVLGAELRIPTDKTASKECIFIFALKSNNTITPEYLIKKYGKKIIFSPPNARGAAHANTYYKLVNTDYAVSFGFQKEKDVCHELVLKYNSKHTQHAQ